MAAHRIALLVPTIAQINGVACRRECRWFYVEPVDDRWAPRCDLFGVGLRVNKLGQRLRCRACFAAERRAAEKRAKGGAT